jgi:hypothetical protein
MAKKTAARRRSSEVAGGLRTVSQIAATAQAQNPTTIQSILRGSCIVCTEPLDSHFREGRWIGCTGKRRAGDSLFVPPMTILLTPGSGVIAPETFVSNLEFTPVDKAHDMGYIRRAADSATETLAETGRRVKRQFKSIRKTTGEAAAGAGRRGRAAFLYFVNKAMPKDITEGDAKFYKMVASHKKGMLFKDIVERTGLKPSTADWARIRLMKLGAITRKPMTA